MKHRNFVVPFLFLLFLYISLSDGVKVCGHKMLIPDNHMSASSEDPNHPAKNGRPGYDSGWSPNGKDNNPYLQINLGGLYLVCGFKVQGCSKTKGGPAWVTRYRVQVSAEKDFWDEWNYIKPEFYGGESAKEITYRNATERKAGQYVRIFPVAYENIACVKMEIYTLPYVVKNKTAFILNQPARTGVYDMSYTGTIILEVNNTLVTVAKGARTKTAYDFRLEYGQITPGHLEPLKTELRVDACVLVRPNGHDYLSGRVHDAKGSRYLIELFRDMKPGADPILAAYTIDKLKVVFGTWCKRIKFFARWMMNNALCRGEIVRVDSKLVFKPKGKNEMIRISYQKKDRKKLDFVSSRVVEPSSVTVGETILYFEEPSHGCLFEGTVKGKSKDGYTFVYKRMRKTSRKVYYYGERPDKCGKRETHCQESRIPFVVNRKNCSLRKTWDGKRCTDEDECKTGFASCGLHATCKDTPGFYECSCPKDFQKNSNPHINGCVYVDECKDPNKNKCAKYKNAVCVDFPGGLECRCKEGYHGVDINSCKLADKCKLGIHKCDKWASCKDTNRSYECHCKAGFQGNGKQCRDIDECSDPKTHNCSKALGVMCKNIDGSYKCVCKSGYSGDGIKCMDVDECTKNENACDKNADCKNTEGSYLCTCKKGYTDDGHSCSDIDECSSGDSCGENAFCANGKGTYWCNCKLGYHGDPYKKCKDVDECKLINNICGYGKTCTNTVGSYNCSCAKGFFLNDTQPGLCEDKDECKTLKKPCGILNYLECVNQPGTYTCRCKTGYNFNKKQKRCEDIDECSQETAVCVKHSECLNSEGNYQCTCVEGFYGDGKYSCHRHGNGASLRMSNQEVQACFLLFVYLAILLIVDPWNDLKLVM